MKSASSGHVLKLRKEEEGKSRGPHQEGKARESRGVRSEQAEQGLGW